MVLTVPTELPARGGNDGGARGLHVDRSCIWRWVQIYGPEVDQRCRRHLKPTNKSWRLDETYIKVKGRDRFLYRAVDSTGQTIDFLLTDRRDAAAAKRFFRRALENLGNSSPRVINVDKNPAYPRAVEELKKEGTISRRCRLRQCKYLNNIVEIVFERLAKLFVKKLRASRGPQWEGDFWRLTCSRRAASSHHRPVLVLFSGF